MTHEFAESGCRRGRFVLFQHAEQLARERATNKQKPVCKAGIGQLVKVKWRLLWPIVVVV
jgi:hypothetical protein